MPQWLFFSKNNYYSIADHKRLGVCPTLLIRIFGTFIVPNFTKRQLMAALTD